MSHIFISYSHKDKAYVHKLRQALIDRGFDVWIDDRIDYGSRWPREIETRLQGCSAFILLMSPASNESDWVQNELLTAQKLKKPILPLLLEGEVWWHLQTSQYVDVTGDQLPPEKFFINLASIVGRHQANAERISDPAEKPKNEAPAVHIEGNVSGSTIIVGERNAIKSRATLASTRAKPPFDYAGKRSAQGKRSPSLRSQLAGFVPATTSGKLTIFLTVLAAISVCAAFVWSMGVQYALFGNISTATLTPALTASATSIPGPSLTPTLTATIIMTIAPSLTPTFEVSSTPTPYPAQIAQKGAEMALIPAGKFPMGSDNRRADEKPVHTVSLDAFYMDKYEVTNALYKMCVGSNGCQPPQESDPLGLSNYYQRFDNYPVVYVNWNEAKTYCEWRGARLPSEAEWEYAARGTDGRTYPWGEEINCSKAHYFSCEANATISVGRYESGKSPFGLYDMAGNVWEWVNDWYSAVYYQSSPQSNPPGPDTAQYHVLRGGEFSGKGYDIRAAGRNEYDPVRRNTNIGFRCALTP